MTTGSDPKDLGVSTDAAEDADLDLEPVDLLLPELHQQFTTAASAIRTFVFHPTRRGGRVSGFVVKPSETLFTPTDMRSERRPSDRLEEAVSLAAAINLDVVESQIIPLSQIKPATYLGSGKVDELKKIIADNEIDLVVADCALSPVQQRNLERAWKVKVIDRTGLILEIFGARAHTREGRLQVELASLNYQKSRLVRSWTHLERQRGGLGKTGGPGETQIESDRRLIDENIIKIKRALEQVVRTRALHRASRRKVPYPIVSLVGYTNAGKSTLFNRLTTSDVLAEDMLFATLDPTMRRLKLPSGRQIIFSDTVGFISDLPTHLVAAFRATLEEVLEADIIVHVRDIAHPDTVSQREDVNKVLKSLDAEAGPDRKIIEVLNKIDLLPDDERAEALNRTRSRDDAVALSAVTGEGVDDFLNLLDRLLGEGGRVEEIFLNHADGKLMAWLYKHGDVLSSEDDGAGGVKLRVRLDAANRGKLISLHPGILPADKIEDSWPDDRS